MVPMLRSPMARRAAVFGLVCLVGACATGPIGPQVPAYVVFFTPYSSQIDGPAATVVADASRAAVTAPSRRLVVSGYADRAGTPLAEQVVSQQRAQAVADALVARGVDRARITMQPKGRVEGDPGVESRRVEIEFP